MESNTKKANNNGQIKVIVLYHGIQSYFLSPTRRTNCICLYSITQDRIEKEQIEENWAMTTLLKSELNIELLIKDLVSILI